MKHQPKAQTMAKFLDEEKPLFARRQRMAPIAERTMKIVRR